MGGGERTVGLKMAICPRRMAFQDNLDQIAVTQMPRDRDAASDNTLQNDCRDKVEEWPDWHLSRCEDHLPSLQPCPRQDTRSFQETLKDVPSFPYL